LLRLDNGWLRLGDPVVKIGGPGGFRLSDPVVQIW